MKDNSVMHLRGDRTCESRIEHDDYGSVRVVEHGRLVLAQALASRGGENHLAICLGRLSEANIIDIQKLRAALELAGPLELENDRDGQPLELDAVRRIVFLHGKEDQSSVVYREAVEELAHLGLDPG